MKSIVILGNGKSITKIDYTKIPQQFHTFRVNNFYFEDKYYLGKQVNYYLCGVGLIEDQFFNITHLRNNKEYSIDQVYIHNHHQLYQNKNHEYIFPSVQICNKYLESIPYIYQLLRYYEFYYNKSITAGTIAILTAIGLGYKEIYIAGIDFYTDSEDSSYPFSIGQNFINIRKFKYNVHNTHHVNLNCHNLYLDKEIVSYIINHTDIHLYSIAESSINSIIPIAPINNNTPYKIELKPKHYLNDWLYLPKDLIDGQFIYEKVPSPLTLKQKVKQICLTKISDIEWEHLKQNNIIQFIYHIIKHMFRTIRSVLLMIKIIYKLIRKKSSY